MDDSWGVAPVTPRRLDGSYFPLELLAASTVDEDSSSIKKMQPRDEFLKC
jgi:hypothetical protein